MRLSLFSLALTLFAVSCGIFLPRELAWRILFSLKIITNPIPLPPQKSYGSPFGSVYPLFKFDIYHRLFFFFVLLKKIKKKKRKMVSVSNFPYSLYTLTE